MIGVYITIGIVGLILSSILLPVIASILYGSEFDKASCDRITYAHSGVRLWRSRLETSSKVAFVVFTVIQWLSGILIGGCLISLLTGCGGSTTVDTAGRDSYTGKWSYHTGWPDSVRIGGPNGFYDSKCDKCHVNYYGRDAYELVPGWVSDPDYIDMTWAEKLGVDQH